MRIEALEASKFEVQMLNFLQALKIRMNECRKTQFKVYCNNHLTIYFQNILRPNKTTHKNEISLFFSNYITEILYDTEMKENQINKCCKMGRIIGLLAFLCIDSFFMLDFRFEEIISILCDSKSML